MRKNLPARLALRVALFTTVLCVSGWSTPAFAVPIAAPCGPGITCDPGLICAPNPGGVSANTCQPNPAAPPPANNTPFVINQPTQIQLMKPFGASSINIGTGLNVLFNYFNAVWPWLLGVCAGIAILQGVVGGIEIMYSGSPDLKSRGGERLMWALAGLLMLGLSAIILNLINPGAYAI